MGKIRFLIAAQILLSLICYTSLAVAISNITTDQSALLALKSQITHDPNNTLITNWSATASVCDWIGVTCNSRHRRVTAVNLAFMGLTGTIPPQIGNLSFLSLLNITNNSFYGTLPNELVNLRRLKYLSFRFNSFNIQIPPWIGFLPKLEYLFLNGNGLTGNIPPTICNVTSLLVVDLSFNQLSGFIPSMIFNISSLLIIDLSNNQLSGPIPSISNASSLLNIDFEYNSLSGSLSENWFRQLPNLVGIYLSYNQLTGQIPSTLFQCKHLQILSLSVNNFTGIIPKEIANLTMLQGLYLGSNHLSGPVPEEIGNLQNLAVLSLASNSLTGTIPLAIFNISTLQIISLTANQLSGSLPSRIGLWLPKLEQLFLGGNRLTGEIPSSITNASMLTILELAFNSFSGLIPTSLGNLRSLQWLNLGVNNLTADSSSTSELNFLSSLTNCRYLRKIILTQNPLNGVLPTSIGNLSISMEQFSLADCGIKGSIPKEIGNLSNLVVLHLYGNELTGPVPDTVGRLQNLQGLYLHNNSIQGYIPSNLCLLASLAELYLDNNNLTGSLPACFGNLISLRTLSLGSNRLTFSIPSSLWSLKDILQVNLSSNFLNGSLPLIVRNLKVVTEIDLSRNQLSGDIPTTFGGFSDLRKLSLAENKLQGPIPQSFGNLRSLEFLDLSSNDLSGEIPMSWEALLYLKYLNLSYNRLEGEIPPGGPFANFSAQSFIGNNALCGATRLGFPACQTKSLRRSRRTIHLLAYILPASVVMIMVLLTIILLLIRRRKRNNVQSPSDGDAGVLPVGMRRVTYQELLRATDKFSERKLLGIGSFGSVYEGTIWDGMKVAIKVFNLQVEGAFKSFDAECEVLRNIRHRNLVRIISSCSNNDLKALVLEYMPKGSLETWLYSTHYRFDILQILNIMIDVASALEYLHFGCLTPIVHCDLKPSNILLDDDMVAHLSDFGIAKLLGEGESITQTQTLATIGYIAPEYGREGKISRKGDVYSYGIVLMETMTRTKPTDEKFAGELSLKSWLNNSLNDSIMRVVDASSSNKNDAHFAAKEQCVSSILSLAMDCTRDSPERRINMPDVVAALKKIRVRFLASTQQPEVRGNTIRFNSSFKH